VPSSNYAWTSFSKGDPADVEAMVAKTVATFGPIQILVNNAGVFEYRSLPEITE
jgi:3-oxoacyl-[acyl-carrier protein] reductase